MSECPHKSDCALFPKFQTASALKIWVSLFCDKDYERCERFKLSCQGKNPPIDLLPNGKMLSTPPKRGS